MHYTSLLPDCFALPTDEHELLEEALRHWQDPGRFSDEKVSQVKDIFRKVFGLSPHTLLAGSSLPDSIILQGSNDIRTFYAIIHAEPPMTGWKAYELYSEGDITWPKNVPIRSILNQYERIRH